MKETYLARGICSNCGYCNYPQWGEYPKGVRLDETSCPKCGCMTWSLDKTYEDPDVGKTAESL